MVVKYSEAGAVGSNIVQNILDEYQVLGDQDFDGSVNVLDVILLVNIILRPYFFTKDLSLFSLIKFLIGFGSTKDIPLRYFFRAEPQKFME